MMKYCDVFLMAGRGYVLVSFVTGRRREEGREGMEGERNIGDAGRSNANPKTYGRGWPTTATTTK